MAKSPEPTIARAPEPVAKSAEPTARRAAVAGVASGRCDEGDAFRSHRSRGAGAQRRAGDGAAGGVSAVGESQFALRPPGRRSTCRRRSGWRRCRGGRLDSAAAPLVVAAAAASPAATPAPAVPPADDGAVAAPPDFMLRANELLSTQIPRIAQRAERMVLRVLVAAGRADEDGSDDDEIRLAASGDPARARRPAADAHRGPGVAPVPRGRAHRAAAWRLRRGGGPADAGVRRQPGRCRDRRQPGLPAPRQSPGQAEAARRLALHALTLHDWKYPSGRIEDWNTFAIASALTGRERDARNAWLVALALAGGSERQCRAALDAYALYGEALRSPVEAMLYRANAATRSPRSRLCEWPPHWSASTR